MAALDFAPASSYRSWERPSVSTVRDDDRLEGEKAELERIFSRQLQERKVVLVLGPKGWKAVRLRRLGDADRDVLLQKLYKTPEDEQLGFFSKVAERMQKAGIPDASIEVRFKNLTVTGMQVIKPETPGQRSFLHKLKATLKPGQAKDQRPWPIIDKVSGVLKPRRLTLLLGTPGAGRSLLMKALAGRLTFEKTLRVTSDELTYNGQSLTELVPERSAAFISQLDEHFGELTVWQTLDFAARCQGNMRDMLELLEAKEKELGIQPDEELASFMAAALSSSKGSVRVDVVLRTLGLDHVADTLVGNAMIRGISGGQKKRVTGGEMLVGPIKLLFADEISTGLDSATTYDIVRSMRVMSHTRGICQLIALLQPTPETISLFDDVMMLSAGKIIFHGPREMVLPFFEDLGFSCPPRKNMADFLQEVSILGDQKRYWKGDRAAYTFVSPQEIADTFYSTTEPGKDIMRTLEQPFNPKGVDMSAIITTKYGASLGEMTRACLRRGLQLTRVQMPVNIGRLAQVVFLSFVVGTLFLQEDKGFVNDNLEDSLTAGSNFMGVLFFSCITFIVGSFADSAIFVQSLPVWYKHRTAKFHPAACFALSAYLMRLPWTFVDSWVWTLMVYFCVGFNTSTRIFAFWGTIFALGSFSLTLFLACAALMRNVAAATAVEAALLLLFVNLCGFVINSATIPGGWIAVYWANPVTYMFTSLAVNEFTSPDWGTVVDQQTGQTIGDLVLETRGYQQKYLYVWLAIFVWGVGASVLNFSACVFFLATLPAPKPPVVISEEAYELQLKARAGLDAELPEELRGSSKRRRGSSASLASLGKSASQPQLPGTGSGEGNGKLGEESAKDVEGGPGSKGGSSLPFKTLSMTFSDVRYSVPYPKDAHHQEAGGGGEEGPHAGQLLLLKGITGSFRAGVLTALMGASGAGKTTLMDVLAGRKTGGLITGDIRVNGFPQDKATFARVAGYCEQTDIHVPHTSVLEALQFSARLRLPSSVSREECEGFVHEVMDLVELAAIKDATVGLPGVGLSVEQRKRLTIAVELVANPSILFLDEPTSGLDARAAAVVMRAVRNTVNTGRAVVATVHQPSLEIFEEFHELLLLKRGGETIFQGPIGTDSQHLIAYFQGISGVVPIKPGVNAANWMLDVSSPDAEKKGGHDFAQIYRTSQLSADVQATVAKFSEPAPGDAPLRLEDMKVASWASQLKELTHRNSREMVRVFTYNGIRGVIALACAIIFATLFANQGQEVDDYVGVLNVAGAMYSGTVFIGVIFCFQTQDPVSLRRSVFYREHAAGTYGVVPYWFAEFAAEFPWILAYSLFYSIILYFSIGFISQADKFFFFFLMQFLNLSVFLAFGMLVVHVTPVLEAANALAGTFFAMFNLLCGFMKPQPSIPAGWIWAYWADPLSYTLYGLVVSQLGDVTTPTNVPGGQTVPVNEYIESYFGFKRSFMGYTALVLIGFLLFFRGLALLALSKLNFQRR